MNIGVPQGTILGPILFLLYLNDLSSSINKASINIYIYADDVIYYSNSSFDLMQETLQYTMDKVFEWYTENNLSLSINKCNTMVIDIVKGPE